MRTWTLAPSLDAARSEADRLAPRRSRRSDGTIGDAAHSASVSDHNPTAAGWVNALDLTHDPAGGFNAHGWADVISLRNDPRVKYLISAGRIWNPTRGDRPGAWRPYTGSNRHDSHLHISIRDTPAARNDRGPWFLTPEVTPPMVDTTQHTIYVENVETPEAEKQSRGSVWAIDHTTCVQLRPAEWLHRVKHENAPEPLRVNTLQLVALTFSAGRRNVTGL